MRTVRVKWKGPLSLDDVKELDDEDDDCGLYQIYGRHIIFGDDSLLYVGMTPQLSDDDLLMAPNHTYRGLWRRRGCRFMWVELWKKIMSMIRRFGQIGRMFLKMLRHLPSNGTHRRIIHATSRHTTVSD